MMDIKTSEKLESPSMKPGDWNEPERDVTPDKYCMVMLEYQPKDEDGQPLGEPLCKHCTEDGRCTFSGECGCKLTKSFTSSQSLLY
jgi:hypothetical protein